MELLEDLGEFLVDSLAMLVRVFLSLPKAFFLLFLPRHKKSLSGCVAVVTGAAHGIGMELALQLGAMGVKVACWDINGEGAEMVAKLVRERGGQAKAFTVDVSDKEAVMDNSKATVNALGEVNLLFNNAGIMPCKPFLTFTQSEVEHLFSVNAMSHFWSLQAFLPSMIRANRGHIVAMSSVAGLNGLPNLTPYCSTKFAVKGLMDSLFLELRSCRSSIGLTTVYPYIVDTGLAKNPAGRFMSVLPFTSAARAARLTIQAVREDKEQLFIPAFLEPLYRMFNMWPREAQLAVLDWCNVSLDHTREVDKQG